MSENDDLDFERADFSPSEGNGGVAAPTGRVACSVCGNEIADVYFTCNDAFVCARCEGPTREAGPPGSAASRLAGAIGAGLVAATLASALWMVVTELTGYEIGLIAIAVGWIVGVAVMIGSRGTGGPIYQVLAIFLTYTAIVMTYVPTLVPEIQAGFEENERARVEAAASEALADPAAADPLAALEREAELAPSAEDPPTVVVWGVAMAIAYAVPFLSGFENAIGLLIIGFGLYQAWSMTARRAIRWAGPFQLGSGPTPRATNEGTGES